MRSRQALRMRVEKLEDDMKLVSEKEAGARCRCHPEGRILDRMRSFLVGARQKNRRLDAVEVRPCKNLAWIIRHPTWSLKRPRF